MKIQKVFSITHELNFYPMNSKFITSLLVVGLLLFINMSSALARTIDTDHLTTISKDLLKDRLELISTDVELRYTSEVHQIINNFISRYRHDSEILLGRGNQYFPIYEHELEKYGLPSEIKYLSVIESSLVPTAKSQTGARGLWQFIPSTGKLYGLTINNTVDERLDITRSTQAAVRFLKDLYEQFGDWSLALAAYNCGPGGVKKAQRYANADDADVFWDIRSFLPKETRRYVPKFIAMNYLMNYFEVHGLEPSAKNMVDVQLATLRVHDYISFKELSQSLDIDYRLLKKLNPAFLRGYIPKSSKGYVLTLPLDKMNNFLSLTGDWDNIEFLSTESDMYEFYLYGSMKRKLMEMKPVHIPALEAVDILEEIDIQPSVPGVPPAEMPIKEEKIQTAGRYRFIILQPQQSLMDVVAIYDITLEELIKLNEIDLNDPPSAGTELKISMVE